MENYIRECPNCFNEIKHKHKNHMELAKSKGSLCRSCCNKGENNPFYGRSHDQKTIDKIVLTNRQNIEKYKSDEFRNKMSKISSGENNPMFGRSVYDIWVGKYGKETADIKMTEYKKKQSINNSGEKNNMFGKPSPSGSGNGWSGWYKGIFFKSLKELSCILTFESKGITFESAESKKFKIEYIDWDNRKRNYYPDFFISSTKTLIECKPKHLFNSANVICKRKYAEIFCRENGFIYEMVDPVRLSDDDILRLYKSGDLKFIDRYDEKFRERLNP